MTRVSRVLALTLAALVAIPHAVPASAAPAGLGPIGEFFPLSPARIVDTRSGLGAGGPVQGPGTIDVKVAGVPGSGVPASGVLAVALNVTVTQPSAASYLTVYPTGAPTPVASNLNFSAGETVPNLVVVAVGAGGRVTAFLNGGRADVVIDVMGWWAAGDSTVATGAGGRLQAVDPQRILDTRTGVGWPSNPGPHGVVDLQVAGRFHDRNGVAVAAPSAVVLNLTGVNSTADTFITAYPGDESIPRSSNVNLVRGQVRPNLVMVKVGANGHVRLYNEAGTTGILADVVGYFQAGASPTSYSGRVLPLTAPYRLFDTRSGAALGAGDVDSWDVSSFLGALATSGGTPGPVSGLVVNLTGTGSTAADYLTAFPSDVARPVASNVNLDRGGTAPNLAVVPLSTSGKPNRFSVFNYAGGVHTLADVAAVILSD
jgi:hypothetical protein